MLTKHIHSISESIDQCYKRLVWGLTNTRSRRIQVKSSKATWWTFAWILKGARGLPGRSRGAKETGAPEAPEERAERSPLRNPGNTTRNPSTSSLRRPFAPYRVNAATGNTRLLLVLCCHVRGLYHHRVGRSTVHCITFPKYVESGMMVPLRYYSEIGNV